MNRAFTTVFAGPIAIADPSVGWKTWIWFLVFNFIAIPYGKWSVCSEDVHPLTVPVYFCCPETRGRTLEEIDLVFITESLKDTSAAKTLQHEGHESSTTSESGSVREKTIISEEKDLSVDGSFTREVNEVALAGV
jgi:hypothetical protein